VVLEENVWIGDSAIVCKGVTIGKNSIIGAGAVVTSDIPTNAVAAGNPARVIRRLDPARQIVTRKDRYGDTEKMTTVLETAEKDFLEGNTFLGWIRSLIAPGRDY
jgi:serine acetyltransferase